MGSCGDMSDLDQDSEFDSEEEELEFRLYQQLYFEPNSDTDESNTKSRSCTLEQHDRIIVSDIHNKQYIEYDNHQLGQLHDPKHTTKLKTLSSSHTPSPSTPNNNENPSVQINSCNIKAYKLEGAEFSLTDGTVDLSAKNAQNNLGNTQQFLDRSDHEASVTDNVSVVNRNTLHSLRERVSSICSDGSLSGSVPLDVLYCNIATSNEEDDIITNRLIMKDINTNDQERGKDKVRVKCRKRKRSSCSDDDAEDSRCDNLITVATNKTINKDVYLVGDDSNSDDDLCILPPSKPSHPEILTLESSSDGEVKSRDKDETCMRTKDNKYLKIDQPLSSTLKNKIEKSKEVIQPLDSRGKQGTIECVLADESESDSNDVFMPEASRGTDLILNIDKSLSGWVKTITKDPDTTKRKEKVVKKTQKKIRWSSVDFTKGRPKTTRKPSCEKWSQSMATFYDSDVSDDIDVSKIHFQQSDSPSEWHIIGDDLQIIKRKRYYNAPVKCKQCREEGHSINNCPRVPVCHLCSSTDHTSRRNCPENCCFKCGGNLHYLCPLTDLSRTCNLCGMSGHLEDICPDLWRRFHLTTSGLVVQTPTEHNTRPKTERYCCSCGKQGHYGYKCPLAFQNRSYAQVPQSVTSYNCPVSIKDGYFVVNMNGAQSASQEEDITRVPIKSKDVSRIIGKKGAVIKSIIKESGAHVHIHNVNQPQVMVYGPLEARLKAEERIKVLIGKKSNRSKFAESLNPIPMTSELSERTSSISGFSNIDEAAVNSDKNPWCKKFVANLDKRKDHVLKEMRPLFKSPKKYRFNVSNSIEKLKSFKLRRTSEPSLEPSKVIKRHLNIIAKKCLRNKEYGGQKLIKKCIDLRRLIQSSSGVVPENICFEIASTVEPLYNTSNEKIDILLEHAERYKHDCLEKKAMKKRRKNESNKNGENVDVTTTENKKAMKKICENKSNKNGENMDVTTTESKKPRRKRRRKRVRQTKKGKGTNEAAGKYE